MQVINELKKSSFKNFKQEKFKTIINKLFKNYSLF